MKSSFTYRSSALWLAASALTVAMAVPSSAHADDLHSSAGNAAQPSFDIVKTHAHHEGGSTHFEMELAGEAGAIKPEAIGSLTGAGVNAYVFVTGLDPAQAGFDPASGILAVAVTAHPDFDDTPLYDENGDGDAANDGADWHSHLVVLSPTDDCTGGFKVNDIQPGEALLPADAPGLPIALSSPDARPDLSGSILTVSVELGDSQGAALDGVTSALQVNETGEAPLLCVTEVFDIASGDLSLSGTIGAAQ